MILLSFLFVFTIKDNIYASEIIGGNLSIGDKIEFGHYIDNKEPLTWTIIDVDKNTKTYTLFCDAIVTKYRFNERSYAFITWKQSDLRYYMNGELKYKIFDERELVRIVKTENNNSDFPIYITTKNQSIDELYILSESDIYKLNIDLKNRKPIGISDELNDYFLRNVAEDEYMSRVYTSKIVDKKNKVVLSKDFEEEHGIRPVVKITFNNLHKYSDYIENDKKYQVSILNDRKANTPYDRVSDENLLDINNANYIYYDRLQKSDANYKKIYLGDIVIFGKYEQDDNAVNGKENIEWIVAKIHNNKALLITKNMIDMLRVDGEYTTVPYSLSYERYYLHKYFYYEAFSELEKDAILWSKTKYYRFKTHSIDNLESRAEQFTSTNKVFCPSYVDVKDLKNKYFDVSTSVKRKLSKLSSMSELGVHKCFLSDNVMLKEATVRYPTYMIARNDKINRGTDIFTLDSDMGCRLCIWVDLDKINKNDIKYDTSVSAFSSTKYENEYYTIRNPYTGNLRVIDNSGNTIICTVSNDDSIDVCYDKNNDATFLYKKYTAEGMHSYIYDKTGKNIIFDRVEMCDYKIIGNKIAYTYNDDDYNKKSAVYDIDAKKDYEYGEYDKIFDGDKYIILLNSQNDKTLFIDCKDLNITHSFNYSYDSNFQINDKIVYAFIKYNVMQKRIDVKNAENKSLFYNFCYDDMKIIFDIDVRCYETLNVAKVKNENIKKLFLKALEIVPLNKNVIAKEMYKVRSVLEYKSSDKKSVYDKYSMCFDANLDIVADEKFAYIEESNDKYIIDVSDNEKYFFDNIIYIFDKTTSLELERNIFSEVNDTKTKKFHIFNHQIQYLDEDTVFIGNDGYYIKNDGEYNVICDIVSNNKIYVTKDIETIIVQKLDGEKYFLCGSKSYKDKYCDIYDANGKLLYEGVEYDHLKKKLNDKNNNQNSLDIEKNKKNKFISKMNDSLYVRNENSEYVLENVLSYEEIDFGIVYQKGFNFGFIDNNGKLVGEYSIFDSLK